MTNKSTRCQMPQKPDRSVYLAVLVPTGIATMFAIANFLAMRATAPYTPEVTGRAAAQISETHFAYGDVHYNTPVTTSFQVKNVGDDTLFILGEPQIEVLEGCCPPTVRTSNRQLAPGDEATVSFTFTMHAGMDGPHHFRVRVLTNDPKHEEQFVHVLSNWIP